MSSNHEKADAIFFFNLEFLIQLLVDAPQLAQFPAVVWLFLNMSWHWRAVSNFVSFTSDAGVEGFATYVYTGCTLASFCGSFPPSC